MFMLWVCCFFFLGLFFFFEVMTIICIVYEDLSGGWVGGKFKWDNLV